MDEFAFALESPCTDIPLAKCIEVATYRSMESGVTGQNVADFYRGRYVFMTGGTGFIGKVLIEKLLRCCPDIAGIFVLMRPKKSRTPIQRGEDLCSSLMFRVLRESQPRFNEKLIVVHGDLSEDDFGLHGESLRRVTLDVSVVFHVAATVRFDEPLRLAVQLNLAAIKKLINLCRKIKMLQALIHVSTAYANCNRERIEEKIYPPDLDPEKLMDLIDWLPEEAIEAMTPHLLKKMPNTYTFTKGLAEYYLLKHASDLPLAIVRPSIVGAAWKEPIPGWIDNCNGPSLLFIAAGKGLLRSMMGDGSAVADVVPVDVTVNLLVVVAWQMALRKALGKRCDLTVYNCTTGSINPVRWAEMESAVLSSFKKNPLDQVFRRPKMSFTTSPLMYNYWVSVSHFLPAYITDMALRVVGKKPRLVKTFNRIHKAVDCIQYFTSHEWDWSESNVSALIQDMNIQDRKTFYLDARGLDWTKYFENYCLGTKRFVLNEDLDNLPQARQHLRRLQILRYTFNTILIAMLWRFLIANSHLAGGLWRMVLYLVFKFVRFFRVTSSLR